LELDVTVDFVELNSSFWIFCWNFGVIFVLLELLLNWGFAVELGNYRWNLGVTVVDFISSFGNCLIGSYCCGFTVRILEFL
jgi:hypothetical protein